MILGCLSYFSTDFKTGFVISSVLERSGFSVFQNFFYQQLLFHLDFRNTAFWLFSKNLHNSCVAWYNLFCWLQICFLKINFVSDFNRFLHNAWWFMMLFLSLRKKTRYSELFWSAFFPHLDWIRRDTPYLSVFSPNAGKCGKTVEQNNSEYGHFFRSVFGLYEQLNSHFLSWKFNSIYKLSIGLVSADKKLTGISSLIKTIIPPPCWSRSRRKREVYPGIRNRPTGNDSSSLVSEITNTLMIVLICLASKSNFFELK